ncbi:N-acetylglucosaminyltransferase, partial [Sinorhizobium meliloti]
GFYLFAILNAAIYCLLLLVIVIRHSRENAVAAGSRFYRPAITAGLLAVIALPGIATAEHGKEGLEALAWGSGHLRLFEDRYAVAGAGQGGTTLRKIVFSPRWISAPSGGKAERG